MKDEIYVLRDVAVQDMVMENLTDISQIKVCAELQPHQRMIRFMDDIGNPYCFRCGSVGVKIEFQQNTDITLQEKLTAYFTEKQKTSTI